MKFQEVCSFIRTLKLEPYIFFSMAAVYIKTVTLAKLYQDKVCVNELHYDAQFCKHLNASNLDEEAMKATVLADAQLYTMYQALITTIPNTVASFFIGSWLDNYDNSTKYTLLIAAFGYSFEAILLILNSLNFQWQPGMVLTSFIPTAFSGSFIFVLMATFSYIPKTTVPHLRPVRYAILELAYFFGAPVGQYVGGILIDTNPIGSLALHNYIAVFIFALVCQLFCILWVLLVFRDQKVIEPLIEDDVGREANNQKWCHIPKNIFVLKNARETIMSCLKLRPNKGRLQLWMLITSLYAIATIIFGSSAILFPFTERVFNWSETTYSTINSVNTVIANILMISAIVILVRKYKVKDIRLAVIGATSYLLQIIIRGSLINEIAFNISYYVGSFGSLSSIGIRSYISQLVPKDELGKVFSMIASLESTIELVSGILFSTLFKLTVKTFPGLLFQIIAVPLFYPLIAVIIIELFYDKSETKDEVNYEKNDNTSVVAVDVPK